MSLGSRIAQRGRVAVFSSLNSTPREPLLFLYPQWIRNSSTTSPAPQARDDNHLDTDSLQDKQITIPKHAATLYDDPAVLDKRFNNPRVGTASDQSFIKFKPSPTKHRPPNITTEDGIASLEEDQNNHIRSTVPGETDRRVRKVLSLQQHNENARESARASRRAYQAYRREEMQAWSPDWRTVLADLIKHTPQHGQWLSKALKFVVPASAAPRLFQGIDDYFLDIGSKYGCVMELGDRDRVSNQYTSFVISGPATAITKCAADILRIAPDVKIAATSNHLPAVPVDEMDFDMEHSSRLGLFDSGVKVRSVMSHSRRKIPLQVLPKNVPRPEEWTHQSFLDYIQALTSCGLSNHASRFGFGSEEDPRDVVSKVLRDVFKDPELRPVITRQACHAALAYFVSTNRIEDARVLFVRMEIMKLKLVPETFNILLAGAAKFNDIHNFAFILHLMLHRGLAPNGRTWVRFMMAFPDVRIKLHILTAMQKKGLLNHIQTLRDVCAQLASPEIESSLDQNQSQAAFVAHMDARYGSAWLSVSSANRILQSLGSHGLISRCWEFLHFMESRSCIPDHYSVHTILHYCKQSTNMTGAIELFRSLPKSMGFIADDETYRILFELAWRLRSYNVAKVIWRYACMSAATSFRMRERVFQSLLNSNRAEIPETARQRWNKFAGPVIIGLNNISEHPSHYLDRKFQPLKTDRLYSPTPEPEEYDQTHFRQPETASRHIKSSHSEVPSLWPEDPFERFAQQSALPKILSPWGPSTVGKRTPAYKIPILKDYFYTDLEIFKQWEPVKPFEVMLAKAMEMDKEWKTMEGYGQYGLEWFLDGRALRIGVKTKVNKVVTEFEWR